MTPSPDTTDRMLPRSQEAERAVLGSMLRDNRCIDDLAALLRTDSFYEDAHQKLFRVLVEMRNANRPIDRVTLAEELLSRKLVDDIGSLAYLQDLYESSPTAANAVYYAKIVKERALVRGIIHVSRVIVYGRIKSNTGVLQ